MTRIILFFVLLLSYCATLTAQITPFPEVIALPDDTLKARQLYDLYVHYRNRYSDSTKVAYAALQELNQRIDDPVAKGDELVIKAIMITFREDRTAVMDDLLAAEEFYRVAGHRQRIGEVLYFKSSVNRILGNSSKAMEYVMAGLDIFQKIGNKAWEALCNVMLAEITLKTDNRVKAEAYGESGVRLARESEDDYTYALATLKQATLLYYVNKLQRALVYANESVELNRQLGYTFNEVRALEARFLIYQQMEEFDLALADHALLMELAPERANSFSQRANLGQLYLLKGDAAKAKEILLEAKAEMLAKGASGHQLHQLYSMLMFAEAGSEKYDSIKHYYNLSTLEMDRLQEDENATTILDLETKYETEKKDLQIENQEIALQRQRRQLVGIGLFLLLALTGGALLYRLSIKLRKRNAENERLVREKETLLGEIHHRVKNNLQVISSLLQIQSRGLHTDDEQARAALEESKSRVQAMGLIHQKLYQHDNVTTVDMIDYLTELGETLLDAYSLNDRVEVYYDVEQVKLDVDTAIPLGLIVNELVANALKYAFPGSQEGVIEIALHREQEELVLTVSDDGVGKAAAPKLASSTSFGSNLVELLSKKLRANLQISSDQGYATTLRFSG